MAKNIVPTEQQLNRRGGRDFNRRQNNFFTGNISQSGENFLDKMHPEEMERSMQRIFREICRGKIDMSEYGVYLAHPILLNTLINASNARAIEANLIFTCIGNSVNMLNNMGQYADDTMTSTQEKYRRIFMAYNLFNTQLSIFRNTGDIMALIVLQNNASAYYDYI